MHSVCRGGEVGAKQGETLREAKNGSIAGVCAIGQLRAVYKRQDRVVERISQGLLAGISS